MTGRILLVGNPNVGKSVFFSRLTGVDVIVSNYPGTTVEFTKGSMKLEGEEVELIDTPGAYSLEPQTKAEKVTQKMVEEAEEGDIIINVIDCTNLERNLYLTLQLLEKDTPIIVALNMWDCAQHQGIKVDVEKLEELLGVPVVPTSAASGEGFKELVSRVKEAHSPKIHEHSHEERWTDIGKIVEKVQKVGRRRSTLWEKFAEASIRPLTGIPLALVVIFLAFYVVRWVGEGLINYVFEPLFQLYLPYITLFGEWLGPGIFRDILIGRLVEGKIVFMESMGLLTTGIYVPFAAVLPYIIAFYFMLSFLEDSGYLPRLATLVDNLFHKLGMHGHGIVSVFLGLGCNVPGALATRTLETRKQRFISATLLAIAVPCMAQLAMIFGVLGRYGAGYLYMVFLILAAVYFTGGILLNKFVKGESPEIFLEVPPYRRPNLKALLKKTWLRIRWFLSEAIPWLFFGILLVNVLYTLGILQFLGKIFSPVMVNLLGLPQEAVVVLLVGFLRKDLAVGMLLPLGMAPEQLVIAVTVLTIYFPCAATFSVLIKELGVKDMLKSLIIMLITAAGVGGILNLLFSVS